jgi:hypothetical protein
VEKTPREKIIVGNIQETHAKNTKNYGKWAMLPCSADVMPNSFRQLRLMFNETIDNHE